MVGSDVAFRKAVEEMIGRALKEGELEKMMEKGLLDPDVLLPKVGKYFSELARAGGALEIKLNQLETIEMRMKMRWEQIQKTVYETGGEKGLKGLYRTLDQIFKMMMDENLVGGGFLKGFLDSATQSLKDIWDLGQKIKIFLMDMGVNNVNGEMFGKAAYWISVAASLQIIYKFTKLIFAGGIIGNIWKMVAAVSALATAESAAATASGAAATGWLGKLGKLAKGAGLPLLFAGAGLKLQEINEELTKNMTPAQQQAAQLDPTNNPTILSGSFSGFNSKGDTLKPIQLITQGAMDINIQMNENAKDIIKAEVKDQQLKVVHSIIPTGLNSNADSNN